MSSSCTSQDEQQQGRERSSLKPEVKKQARKRAPTRNPYQHRVHNMAEARREIVTALRIHRANMRHQQQHRPRLQQPLHHQVISQEQSQAFQGVPPPVDMSYAAASSNHLSSSALAGNYSPSSPMLAYDLAPLEEGVPAAGAAVGGQLMLMEQLPCSLPAQPLGLNLSFQGFSGSLDNANKNSDDPFGVPLMQPSPCPAASSYSAAYSSSPVATAMTGHGGYASSAGASPAALGQVLDGGEMLCSIGGERQGRGLSDTAANAAAASAWWTKIGESAWAAPQTTREAEAGTTDDVVDATGWSEWLCDGGVGVEQEVTAAGTKPGVLETNRVGDGGYYQGDHRPGDSGDDDIALPW